MIPFGLSSLMALSLPLTRRATKCVPANELIPGASAIYLFNEGTGTTLRDYSGNGYDGTLGAAGAAPTWTAEGLSFDGDDYVTCGTAVDLAPAGLTVMAVVNIADDATAVVVAGKSTASTSTATGWMLRKDLGDALYRAYVYDGAGNRTIPAVTAHAAGTWGVVSLVANGTTATMYAGATAGTPVTCSGLTAAPAQNLIIGRHSYSGASYMVGSLAAFAVYPFALTPAQLGHNQICFAIQLAARGVTLP